MSKFFNLLPIFLGNWSNAIEETKSNTITDPSIRRLTREEHRWMFDLFKYIETEHCLFPEAWKYYRQGVSARDTALLICKNQKV